MNSPTEDFAHVSEHAAKQSVPLLAGSVSVPGAAGDADQNAHTQAYESVVDAEAGRYQRFYVESLCEIHFVAHL
jgi:hypothetical protein